MLNVAASASYITHPTNLDFIYNQYHYQQLLSYTTHQSQAVWCVTSKDNLNQGLLEHSKKIPSVFGGYLLYMWLYMRRGANSCEPWQKYFAMTNHEYFLLCLMRSFLLGNSLLGSYKFLGAYTFWHWSLTNFNITLLGKKK